MGHGEGGVEVEVEVEVEEKNEEGEEEGEEGGEEICSNGRKEMMAMVKVVDGLLYCMLSYLILA